MDKYAAVKEEIIRIYEQSNKIYGYPRITEELKKLGFTYNRKTIYKLMQQLNISSIIMPKKEE